MKDRRRLDVSAAAEPMSVNLTAAPVEFVATKDGETQSRPTFTISAYTGAPVSVGNFHHPVIMDLDGMRAAKARIPILRDHDPLRIVGMSDAPEITAAGVRLTGVVTSDGADGDDVVSQAKNGFEWQASVGANITRREFLEAGKKAQVNGREVTGPLIIARESLLLETSFVALGADNQTSASVAATHSQGKATDMDPKFTAWLEAKGFDAAELSESQVEALEIAFNTAQPKKPNARLDDVLAEARKEQERREGIADLIANYLAENPGNSEFIAKVDTLATQAVEAKWSTEKLDTELLRASRPAPMSNFRSPRGNRLNSKVVEAAIAQVGRLEGHEKMFDDQTLQAAHDHFRDGIGLKQVWLMCAEANGHRGSYSSNLTPEVQRAAFGLMSPVHVKAQGFSALDISTILSNTANKFLKSGWLTVDMTPLRIAKITPVRDFKQITTVSLTGDLQFEKVGTAGEIKHGTLGEVSYTNQAETYGRMLAITRQDLINDDLGALTETPRRLGRGAGLMLNHIFWTEFLALEGAGFFAAGNNNINTGVADMTIGGLEATEVIFMSQTDPDGKPAGLTPKILLVPTALKAKAATLMNSERLITGSTTTQGDGNIWRDRFRIESSPYMSNSSYTGYSAQEWYMLADPMEAAVIEIVALNGKVEPTIETADADFNTLGVQMRGYSDVGVNEQEKRAGVLADGNAS